MYIHPSENESRPIQYAHLKITNFKMLPRILIIIFFKAGTRFASEIIFNQVGVHFHILFRFVSFVGDFIKTTINKLNILVTLLCLYVKI